MWRTRTGKSDDGQLVQTRVYELSTGTRISLFVALAFCIAAIILVVVVNRDMKLFAMENAKTATRRFLDHNLAIHAYFTNQLKPELFAQIDPNGDTAEFCPVWMSSTFAVREITKYTKQLDEAEYYYKECAINARSPENEADEYESTFIRLLNTDPGVMEKSEVRQLDGKQFLVTLRRGEVMEQSCLRCHDTPDQAPPGLVAMYGPERSFGRHLGEVVSAISMRIPLDEAFAHADSFSLKLSLLLLLILVALFAAQYYLSKRLMYEPLSAIHSKAMEIARHPESLGQSVPVPPHAELRELAVALNAMSFNLKTERTGLEKRVEERTKELNTVVAKLVQENNERIRVEEALLLSRSLTATMINASPDSAWLLTPEGLVLSTNRLGAGWLGLEPGQLIGRNLLELAPAGLAEDWRRLVAKVFETGKMYMEELVHVGRTYEFNLYPIELEGGVRQVAMYSRDVTDRRKTEEALREVELKQAELTAIRLTAATSAHEINNPLAGITGTLQLLKDDVTTDEDRQMIKSALEAAERIRRVIATMERLQDAKYRPYFKDKTILDINPEEEKS